MSSSIVQLQGSNLIVQMAGVGPQGGTGPQGPPGPFSPVLGGQVTIENPNNVTLPLLSSAVYAFSIAQLQGLAVASGTLNITISINGTPIPGLTNIAVTSTPQTVIATSGNLVSVGNRVTLTISNNSSASGLEFTSLGSIPTS